MLRKQQLVLAAFVVLAATRHHRSSQVDAFSSPAAFSRRTAAINRVHVPNPTSIHHMSSTDSEKESSTDNDGEGASSFDDAAKAIRDEQDAEALARGSGMSDEEEAEYNARTDEFASMKDRIRSRAADMNIEKSVATAEAIKQAELRAKNRAAAPDPSLDMSVFEKRLLSNPEDELTDEEMAEIDPVGQENFFQQAFSEISQTAFPGPIDVAKTVGFMAIIFCVSAFIILKSDEFLRELYINLGFIPAPGTEFDYDKTLTLPKDWDKDLNDLSGVFDVATKAMGVKVPEAPTLNVDVPSDL